MVVDERLVRKLEELLGPQEARALVSEVESRGVSREELREELAALRAELREELRTELSSFETRIDLKLQALEERMGRQATQLEARMLRAMNEQTRSFVRTFYVSNAAMVLAVATLAFGAARLS